MSKRVLFLNRSYWPDLEATGQLLTELCEDLAGRFDVTVVAGQPNHTTDELQNDCLASGQRHGVRIRRVRHTRFAKRARLGRLLNFATFTTSALFACLFMNRADIVVVETDPFTLPLVGHVLRLLWRCRLVVYLQDVYPDVAVALNIVREGFLTRLLRGMLARTYRSADRVVVLSDDMRELLMRWGVASERMVCIPNWVDTARVHPVKRDNPLRQELGIGANDLVVMYSGNIGLTQPLGHLLNVADRLRTRTDIHFILAGNGCAKARLEQECRDRQLPNVRFLDYQPLDRLAVSLSAADLHFIAVAEKLIRCLMPSKLYGVLASGTPCVVMAPLDSELCRTVQDHEVGFGVAPEDDESLVRTVLRAAENRDDLALRGQRARDLALSAFDRRQASDRVAELLHSVILNGHAHPANEFIEAQSLRGRAARKPKLEIATNSKSEIAMTTTMESTS